MPMGAATLPNPPPLPNIPLAAFTLVYPQTLFIGQSAGFFFFCISQTENNLLLSDNDKYFISAYRLSSSASAQAWHSPHSPHIFLKENRIGNYAGTLV